MVYFAYMVARIGSMDYADASAFVAVPLHALGLVVLLVAGLFHAALGVQMIIEDYVTLAQGRQRFVRLSQRCIYAAGGGWSGGADGDYLMGAVNIPFTGSEGPVVARCRQLHLKRYG